MAGQADVVQVQGALDGVDEGLVPQNEVCLDIHLAVIQLLQDLEHRLAFSNTLAILTSPVLPILSHIRVIQMDKLLPFSCNKNHLYNVTLVVKWSAYLCLV